MLAGKQTEKREKPTQKEPKAKKYRQDVVCPPIDKTTKYFNQNTWVENVVGKDKFKTHTTELFIAMCKQLSSLEKLHAVHLTIQRTPDSRYGDEELCLNAIQELLSKAKLLDSLEISGILLNTKRLQQLKSSIGKRKAIKTLKLGVNISTGRGINVLLNLLNLELDSLQLMGLTQNQFLQLTTKLQSKAK